MKFFSILFSLLIITGLTGCSNDDPMIKIHPLQQEYTLNGAMKLDVKLNGAKITFKGASVVVTMSGDEIASLVIKSVVPGYGEITAGGVNITQASDGNGINFEGRVPLNNTEMLIFSGSLSGGKLMLDMKTVPIPAPGA